MDYNNLLGILAGIISIIAFITYYAAIIVGNAKPNRATWFVLTIVGILIASSYYTLGARETIWVPISYIVGPFFVFLLSIKNGEGGWTTFDKSCLSLAGISLFFWIIFDVPIVTFITNILIDLFGFLPTIKKSYINPKSEPILTWSLTFIESVINIFAVTEWRFAIYIYPLYMLVFNGTVLLPLVMNKLRKN